MDEHETQRLSVPRRLEQLEAQNRRMRCVLAAVVTIVGLTLLTGQTTPPPRASQPARTVEVRELVLRDEQGLERAWLGVREGSPRLMFYDAQGVMRLGLRVGEDGGASVVFSDKVRQVRAWLRADADGAASLALRDARGQIRAALAVDRKGLPTLRLFDESGRERHKAP